MTKKKLTYEERVLLQRYHDREVGEAEVEALLSGSDTARDFLEALEEVAHATRAAELEAWEASGAPDSEAIVDQIDAATPLQDRPLTELVGLLERFHDLEATDLEVQDVESLLETRADVVEYLAGLDELHHGLRASHEEMVADVDFGGFFAAISDRLEEDDAIEQAPNVVRFPGKSPETSERPAFDLENHRVMLYRNYDQEATEAEAAQVAAWAEIDPQVAETLGALEELTFAVNVAVEVAQERVDLSHLWHDVETALGEETTPVISLEREREKRGFFQHYRREIFAAAVAALVTIVGLNLVGGPQQVVVEKTVVIVESVETPSADTSVMVTGPMRPASMEAGDDTQAKEEEDETPTVIWLIEPEESEDEPTKPVGQPI